MLSTQPPATAADHDLSTQSAKKCKRRSISKLIIVQSLTFTMGSADVTGTPSEQIVQLGTAVPVNCFKVAVSNGELLPRIFM